MTIAGADDRAPETTALVRRMIADHGFESKCRMLGPVDAAGLDRLYDGADLFVMPSLYEGYGMVIGEAMARGLPIVCTTGGAAAETAPDAAAIKVPPGDVDAFRAALATRAGQIRRCGARMAEASWRAGASLPRWEDDRAASLPTSSRGFNDERIFAAVAGVARAGRSSFAVEPTGVAPEAPFWPARQRLRRRHRLRHRLEHPRDVARLLPNAQSWTLVDYDPVLLAAARERLRAWADHAELAGDVLHLTVTARGA